MAPAKIAATSPGPVFVICGLPALGAEGALAAGAEGLPLLGAAPDALLLDEAAGVCWLVEGAGTTTEGW